MRAAEWRLAIATGGAAGLAVSPFWNPGGGWLRPLLAVALIVIVLTGRGRVGRSGLAMVCLAAALAGSTIGAGRLEAIDNSALRGPTGPVTMTGFAVEPPSDSRGTARFALETERGLVQVDAPSGEAAEILPGSGIEVSGTLGHAPAWREADLRRRGVNMVLSADRIALSGSSRGGLRGFIDRVRNLAFEALDEAVPRREAALSRGFVLGDDSDIDRRTSEDFRRSGLSHLLAVSGQNIVLLALLAMPFLSLLGIGPRARLLAIAMLILIYVPLAGGGPSIQRAGVMGIAGLVAAAATRAPSRAYALALAALITLGLNPRASGDIGWQLSFAAVVGIMLLARPLQIRLTPLLGARRWQKALAEGIAVTVAATVATGPLIAFHFERLPAGTLFANLAAMPAVAPAMWLGMISIAAGQISPVAAAPFNVAGSVFLAWIAQVAEWFGRPGWAVVEVTIDGLPELGLVTGLLGLLAFGVLRVWRADPAPVLRGRWIGALALVVLLGLVLIIPRLEGGRRQLDSPPSDGARVEVLDIGQGDAILVRPSNADPVLIDGGPPGGDLAGALDSAGVERLAAVLLTHPDLDHFGGLLDLFGLTPVANFLFDQAPPELVSLARNSGVALGRVGAGETVRIGDVRLEVLWPPTEANVAVAGGDPETNARSIVVLLRWRNFRMLLTGDAEAEAVPFDPGPIDVLKVSHHGSEDAGLPALLNESSPDLAVISVGEGNRHGHPSPDVLNDLAAARIRTYRTDEHGTVSIVLKAPSEYAVETGR